MTDIDGKTLYEHWMAPFPSAGMRKGEGEICSRVSLYAWTP
jgi:hypothetical protein